MFVLNALPVGWNESLHLKYLNRLPCFGKFSTVTDHRWWLIKLCQPITLFPYKDPDLLTIPQVRWGAQVLQKSQTVVKWKYILLEKNNQNTMVVNYREWIGVTSEKLVEFHFLHKQVSSKRHLCHLKLSYCLNVCSFWKPYQFFWCATYGAVYYIVVCPNYG